MGDKPDDGPIVINLPGGTTGDSDGGTSGGGSTSGGSTSGGSSAPAAPPMDIYVSDEFKQDAVKRQKMQSFAQLYQQLWGEPATEAYLAQAVNAGLNTWEFAEQEKSKPAFSKTETYKKQAQSLADLLSNLGVV